MKRDTFADKTEQNDSVSIDKCRQFGGDKYWSALAHDLSTDQTHCVKGCN